MKHLDNTINLLRSSDRAVVKIQYKDQKGNYTTIVNNYNKSKIEEKYGSIENLFEELNAKGYRDLRITDRRQAGANTFSFQKVNDPYDVVFETKNEDDDDYDDDELNAAQSSRFELEPNKQNLPTIKKNNMSDLSNSESLNVFKIHHYETLKGELLETKAEIIQLKKENEKLKEDNLRNELLGIKSVEKTKAHGELLEKANPIIALIGQALMAKSGLTQPVGVETGLAGYSPIKQQFLNIDDSFLQDLLPVVQGMQNDSFDAELTSLLQKYNLITN